MTLDEMKAIAARRTAGEWDIDEATEAIYAGPIAISDVGGLKSHFDEIFVLMVANHIDRLLALAEAAKISAEDADPLFASTAKLKEAIKALEEP